MLPPATIRRTIATYFPKAIDKSSLNFLVAAGLYRPVICGWHEYMEDAARNSYIRAVPT